MVVAVVAVVVVVVLVLVDIPRIQKRNTATNARPLNPPWSRIVVHCVHCMCCLRS